MIYTLSPTGLALIEKFEGCVLSAYQDPGGVWTIGYGSTVGVHQGLTITQEQASARLSLDVQTAVSGVNRKVGPALSQNEFDALVSFTFNVGVLAFAGSTLCRLLNAGETAAAAQQFVLWVHDAKGEVLPGLVARRQAERDLFLKP